MTDYPVIHIDSINNIVGAIKAERLRTLAIIDRYIEICRDAPRVVKMLEKLKQEVERET